MFIAACGVRTKDFEEQTAFQSGVTCKACLLPGKTSTAALLSVEESGIIDNDSERSPQQGEQDIMATSTEDVKAKAATEAPTEEKAAKKVKAPLPDGYVTPVEFAHRLGERLNQNRESIRPQIIYGYLKNNAAGSKNPFPSKQNTDGAWIVDEAAANTWYDALQGRKGDREKAKAEKEKADAAKANTAAAVAPTPETSKA